MLPVLICNLNTLLSASPGLNSAINANVDGFVEYLSQRARDGVSYTITTKNINEIKPDGNCLKYFVAPPLITSLIPSTNIA